MIINHDDERMIIMIIRMNIHSSPVIIFMIIMITAIIMMMTTLILKMIILICGNVNRDYIGSNAFLSHTTQLGSSHDDHQSLEIILMILTMILQSWSEVISED